MIELPDDPPIVEVTWNDAVSFSDWQVDSVTRHVVDSEYGNLQKTAGYLICSDQYKDVVAQSMDVSGFDPNKERSKFGDLMFIPAAMIVKRIVLRRPEAGRRRK